jgi:hypothetical protein
MREVPSDSRNHDDESLAGLGQKGSPDQAKGGKNSQAQASA